jgi:hypothetical protein
VLQVSDQENYLKTQDKVLEAEVAEKALFDMRQDHTEAKRRFCGSSGVLHNKRQGTKRQVDEVIEANNCVKVLEVRGCNISTCISI